jgi:hypothetical protein
MSHPAELPTLQPLLETVEGKKRGKGFDWSYHNK